MITLQERVHAASRPDDWQLDKLHQVFRVRRGNKNTGMKEDNLLSLSYGRIIQKDIDTADGLLPENFEGYQIVEPGNIVLRLTDLQNDKRSLRQGLVTQRGIITSAYDAVEIQRDNDPRFWFYSLLALDLAKHYYSLGGGVRQSVKFADFPNDWVYRPDLVTQRQIADFLDRETARIDLLIEKKQRLVALLEERKLGELTRRVTGRDDNRPKVFSGYDWIGEIPFDWQAKRLKFVTKKIVDGAHFTPTYVDDGVPFLRVTDISKGNRKIDWSSVSQISAEEHKALTRRISARKGDMLLSKNGTVGIPRVVDWDFEFSFFVSLCLIRPTDEINPNLLEMFFRSPIVIDQIDNGSRKTSVINLVMEKIRELVVLVPPKGEQEALVQKCHQLFDYYNGVSERVEKSIDRLKEYRSALITAAVTGQIDVSTYAKSGTPDRRLDAIQAEMGA